MGRVSMSDTLTTKLKSALDAVEVQVVDESEAHRGHAGWRPGGETHFRVRVVAERFAGLTRVARHRLVYDALTAELAESVHALAILCLTPDEVDG